MSSDSINYEVTFVLETNVKAVINSRGPAGKSVEISHSDPISLKHIDIYLLQPITIPEVV